MWRDAENPLMIREMCIWNILRYHFSLLDGKAKSEYQARARSSIDCESTNQSNHLRESFGLFCKVGPSKTHIYRNSLLSCVTISMSTTQYMENSKATLFTMAITQKNAECSPKEEMIKKLFILIHWAIIENPCLHINV